MKDHNYQRTIYLKNIEQYILRGIFLDFMPVMIVLIMYSILFECRLQCHHHLICNVTSRAYGVYDK